MRDAKDYFGKSAALLIALEAEGLRGRGGERYAEANVSKWISGETVPPSNVLLAAARLAHVDVNAYLYPEEAGTTNKEDREKLARLEARHDRDIEELRQEFRNTLQAEMLSLRKSLRQLGQIGRGISTELDEDKRPT